MWKKLTLKREIVGIQVCSEVPHCVKMRRLSIILVKTRPTT